MKLRKLGVLAGTAMLVFAACSSTATTAPSAGGGSAAPAEKGTIDIWSSFPRQGSAKASMDTIINAIKLAFEQHGGVAAGWKINYVDKDDSTALAGQWTPEQAIANAMGAVADPNLVAYIASFNSGASKLSIPILCKAGIAQVGPANTYPGLTKPGTGVAGEPGIYYPNGCKHNYFRVNPADDIQGKVGAAWAKELGATKVYVLDDTQIYGKGVADVFEANAKADGLTILGHDAAPGTATDYIALAQKIKAAGPDLIYYGGITQNNVGQLWKNLREAMPTVKLMAPDGVYEDAFITAAGSAAEGTYLTFGGVTPDQYTGAAATFRDAYQAKYGSAPQVYAIYGYEAANVIVAAIETASKAGATDPAALRAGILDALANTKDFKGVLGTWSFDANGDTSLTTMSGVQVKNGKFVFVKVLGQ